MIHALKACQGSFRPKRHLQIFGGVFCAISRRHFCQFAFHFISRLSGEKIPCVLIAKIVKYKVTFFFLCDVCMAHRWQIDVIECALSAFSLWGEKWRILQYQHFTKFCLFGNVCGDQTARRSHSFVRLRPERGSKPKAENCFELHSIASVCLDFHKFFHSLPVLLAM